MGKDKWKDDDHGENEFEKCWVRIIYLLTAILMRPIFSRNTEIEKIAFLNWRMERGDDISNLFVLADAFMVSAIELAKSCIEDNERKKADALVFPILTNVNHGIELYLKGMIWTLNKLLGSDYKIEGRHNIKQMYDLAKAKIKSYQGRISINGFKEETAGLKAYIDELFAKIKATDKNDKMDFSRYPFSNDYESHFYVDELGNVEVDLENFISRFQVIHEKLESLCSFLVYQELHQDW